MNCWNLTIYAACQRSSIIWNLRSPMLCKYRLRDRKDNGLTIFYQLILCTQLIQSVCFHGEEFPQPDTKAKCNNIIPTIYALNIFNVIGAIKAQYLKSIKRRYKINLYTFDVEPNQKKFKHVEKLLCLNTLIKSKIKGHGFSLLRQTSKCLQAVHPQFLTSEEFEIVIQPLYLHEVVVRSAYTLPSPDPISGISLGMMLLLLLYELTQLSEL